MKALFAGLCTLLSGPCPTPDFRNVRLDKRLRELDRELIYLQKSINSGELSIHGHVDANRQLGTLIEQQSRLIRDQEKRLAQLEKK